MSPTRFLVVGCGFIGTHFARELLARKAETVVLTRSSPAVPLQGAEVIVADACDPAAVDAALGGVTDVIYAAGGLMPSESERDPVRDAALTLPPLLTLLDALANRAASFTLIS